MRINGTAKLNQDEERLREFDGAKLIVDITATNIFPNCPRYIPQLQNLVISDHAPKPGHVPPEAEWKFRDYAKPYLPRSERKRLFNEEN